MRAPGRPGRRARPWRIFSVVCAVGAAAPLAFIAWPLPEGLLAREAIASLRILDREGGLLRELRSREDGRAVPLPPGEPIPPRIRQAFLAAEDARFDAHPGIDPLAMARAAVQNLREGRIVSGASTLTQQLARRLVPRERTFVGKAQEALWAMRLEFRLPKERILREHLDRVPLGNSNHGVEAASHFYFGRGARTLSAGQAALLAGMASSPARYDPFRHPRRARERMGLVLERMVELGFLEPEEARVERETPLDLVPREHRFQAPHLTTHLVRNLGGVGLEGASSVRTSLDPRLQGEVERLVRDELQALVSHAVSQAAVLVVDNASGEVLAYVGSRDFLDEGEGGQNDGVQSKRQPGSALKPFAYGLALASGYTAATILEDVETHLSTPTGAWVPKNYDRRVHGPVRLRAALANSYNVPAVRLADGVRPDRILALLHRAGFSSLDRGADHYGAGVVLGNGDVTLWELARGFRGLARGGVAEPLRLVLEGADPSGTRLSAAEELSPSRFLPADATALLTDILSDEAARSPAFGLENALRLPFPVAAKTGTSRAYVDNWAAGYTAERTVAVWVGNFDGRPMQGVSGISGAGPLFRRVMERAMEGIHPAPLVDEGRFARAEICSLSGARAMPACPHSISEKFLPGTEPQAPCAMHPGEGRGRISRVDPGPRFALWAQAEGWRVEASAPSAGRGELLLPREGDEYLVDPSLPTEAQTIPVRVVPPAGVEEVEIRTDLGEAFLLSTPFASRIPAVRGARRLEALVPGQQRPFASVGFRVQ